WHPLHAILKKYNFSFSHSTPVHRKDNSVLHYHTWKNPQGHSVGSYHDGDTKWSSKVSSGGGHSWTGIGTRSLESHLKNKVKRYKLQNNEAQVAHTKLQEGLLSGYDKV